MRNLFDAHTDCRVFPHELSWEKHGYRWEGLEGQNARGVYKWIWDRWVDGAITHGLEKSHPFHFNRRHQQQVFFDGAKSGVESDRGWLDLYLTSFFNAWVDYQNLYGNKKYTVAFCPWNLEAMAPIERFFDVYPQGFRIQIVRNPLGWWASEKKYGPAVKKVEDYLEERWIKSVEVGMRASASYGDRYVLVHFDDVIENTRESMETLSECVGVRFANTMLEPSINRIPCSSNTSFEAGRTGVDTSVLDRWRDYLNEREIEFVTEMTSALYRRAQHECINHVDG